MPVTEELSERELEILQLVATGATNKEIATQLYISTNTVKVHLRNIFSKIGAGSRTEAAMYAVSNGLVEGVALAVEPEGTQELAGRQEPTDSDVPPTRSLPARLPVAYWGILIVALVVVFGALGFYVFVPRDSSGQAAQASPTPAPRWQALAEMPTPRSGVALAVFGNSIYAIAGEAKTNASAAVERYDPETNTWIRLPDKPTAVADVSAAVIGGKIFVPGGRVSASQVSQKLEIYDPQRDQWTEGAALPEGLSAYALAAFEGRLYLFGGWDGKDYTDKVFEYDPAENAWQEGAPMPTQRGFAGAAVSTGKIFVVGGYDGKRALAVNEVYQPNLDNGQDNPWEQSLPMPAPRYAMAVTSIADTIHVVGGSNSRSGSGPSNSFQFQPLLKQWQEFAPPQNGQWMHPSLAPLGQRLYLIGGQLGEEPTGQTMSVQAVYTVVIPLIP